MPYCLLPRSLSGDGIATLLCSEEAEARFRFSSIQAKYPELANWSDGDPADFAASRHSNRSDHYRIALPEKWGCGGWAKVRFSLAKGTPKATLEVIGRHLDEERIDWLFFTNSDGTRLKGARFRCHHTTSAA